MEFRILGPVEVWAVDGPIDLGGPKSRLLLAALVASCGRPVSQDRLAEALWPDSEAAVDTLQSYVSRLRRHLGPAGRDLVERTERGYRLTSGAAVDSERFAALAEEGRRLQASGDLVGAATLFADALALWRGPAFGELGTEELVRAESTRLDEIRQTTGEDLIGVQVELGHETRVIPELEALLGTHPLRERLWELLMVALSRSGRQAEALRAFQRARRHLGEELGVEPSPRLRELESMILCQDPGLLRPGAERSTPPRDFGQRLPVEATRFVGRLRELEQTRAALGRARLVTLSGAPGVGKTRLATATARYAEGEEGLSVGFVGLADATEPDEAKGRIGAAVAAWRSEPDSPEKFLLVVDNCEHLVDACAERISELLSDNTGLQVLTTSREALRVPGETVIQVPPMTVPSARSAAGLMSSDSVRLFVERCADARPGFTLTPSNSDVVRQICVRLDGIPLALELAAARSATMGLREINRGLERRFDLLSEGYRTAPPRHRTLSAALEWSYQLLDESPRDLLDHLPYFLGEFHARAATVVCADETAEESSVRAALGALVRSSLVQMDERDGEAFYGLLPMVREFLRFKRGRHGFETAPRRRGFLCYLAEWTEPRLRGTREQMWRTLFDGPDDVIRTALDLAYDLHEIEDGSFLAGFVAARASATGRVGFVGGMKVAYIERFETGFIRGARHADANVDTEVGYITDKSDYTTAFFDPMTARRATADILERGVDVVFHAAGEGGGQGVLEAARSVTALSGRHRWVIGVDVDERVLRERELLPHLLTSMRRQVPMSAYEEIKRAVAEGRADTAPLLDLSNEGVGLADDLPEELAREVVGVAEGIISQELRSRGG